MRAVVLEKRGKDGVIVTERPDPVRAAGHALVKMHAASLNRVDVYMRDVGLGITHSLPLIMGVDGVGEIAEVGPGSPLQVGQRVILYPYLFCGRCEHCLAGDQPLCVTGKVLGEHQDGTFAERISVPEVCLLPLPDHVDDLEAATLGVAYLTAWRMVFGKGKASAGKSLLVVGAGGGVAAAAIQLARLAGCRVIATSSSADKLEKARQAGADETIDYTAENTAKAVLALTDGAGVDIVIDNVGEATWEHSLRAVKRGGRIVTCGATTGAQPSADLQRLFIRQISVHGSTMGDLGEFARMVTAFAQGRFKPVVHATFKLSDALQALACLEDPERFGKVVLEIS